MNTCPNCDVPGGVTVIADVPLWPSLVAVIVTGPPAATPLTSPLPFTLAIALLLDCQVTTRPVNGLPFASLGVAVSCTVLPTATPAVAGVTVTGPPGATPLTSPLPFTLAIALLLDCQVITRPVKGLPLASRGVAVSCTVRPIATVPELGVTVTAATGATVTVTLAVPLCPSLVAVIVTGPRGPTPVTTPLPVTLAIALLLACQVITRPVNGLPFASRGVAVSCTVCPCSTLTEAGLTGTAATGPRGE